MEAQTGNTNLDALLHSEGVTVFKLCLVKPARIPKDLKAALFFELVVWSWKVRVFLHDCQISVSHPPSMRWSPFSEQKWGTRSNPEVGRAEESCIRNALFSPLAAAEYKHNDIRCRHLPYRHVKLHETNPRRSHPYQLFAMAKAWCRFSPLLSA